MQKILTAEEMREVDRLTTENYGIPSLLLMENAAHASVQIITKKLSGSVKGKSFLVLCGKGNNGGDGAALARLLAIQGGYIDIVLFGNTNETKGDARVNFEACRKIANYEGKITETLDTDVFNEYGLFKCGGSINLYEVNSRKEFDDLLNNEFTQDWNVVVDAIFGTGLSRPIDGWLGNVINHMNILNDNQKHECSYKRLLVSVDIPSGLSSDLDELQSINFESDLTITFTAPKLANVFPPASNFNEELYIADIGSAQGLVYDSPSQTFLTEKEDVQKWLKQTEFFDDSYKKKRGTVLLIAGSKKYTGAAVLAGNGAMQSGAGVVTVLTPKSALNSVSERILPEVMVSILDETKSGAVAEEAFDEIERFRSKTDAVGIGSGLNSDEKTTCKLVRKVVEAKGTPIVIDADGLNALSPFELIGSEDSPLILTPHEGEFLRLLGADDKEAIKDRVKAVRDFAKKHKVILILKGERTLIGNPNGIVVINPTGNSGLGKAGNGDNLTGIITGFIAQAEQAGVDIFETVIAAVYVAGLAGDIAEKKFGKRVMLASDVRDCLVDAFTSLEGKCNE